MLTDRNQARQFTITTFVKRLQVGIACNVVKLVVDHSENTNKR